MGNKKNPTKTDKDYTQNFLKEFDEKLTEEEGFTNGHRAELKGRASKVKPGDTTACNKLIDLFQTYLKTDIEAPVESESEQPKTEKKTKQPKEKTEYIYRVPTINNAPVVDGKAWVRDLNKVGYTGYTGHENWIVVRAKGRFPSCETEDAKQKGVQVAESIVAS